MWVLRRIIDPMGSSEAIEFLLKKLENTKTNNEFFEMMRSPERPKNGL
jgi:transcription termination factor Rho